MTDQPTSSGHLYSLRGPSAEALTLYKMNLSTNDLGPGQLPSLGFNPLGTLCPLQLTEFLVFPAAMRCLSAAPFPGPSFSLRLPHAPRPQAVTCGSQLQLCLWRPPAASLCRSSSALFELSLLLSWTHLPFFSLSSSPQPLNVDVPEGLVLGHWRPRRSPAQLSQRPCSFLGVTKHSGDTGSVSFLPNTDPSNEQSLLWSSSAWPRLFLQTLLLSKPLPQIFLGCLYGCQLSVKIWRLFPPPASSPLFNTGVSPEKGGNLPLTRDADPALLGHVILLWDRSSLRIPAS